MQWTGSAQRRGVTVILALTMALAGCGGSARGGGSDARSSAPPDKVYRWKLITTWPKNLPGVGTAPERFAEQVAKMSNGRLQIEVYGAGELVPAFEVFDAVSQGRAQMGHGAAYYWRGKLPEAALFTTVPYGLTAQQMNGWLYYGGGIELWRELYARFDLYPIPGGNTGVQMAGWFNEEIESLQDLQGLKMRIPGLGGKVMERAGVTVVSVPGGEIFTSLQSGAVDAAEWVGPYNDLTLGLQRAADYYYYPGWQEPGPTLEALVNKDAWASLPEDLKAIVETATKAMNTDMLAEYTARNSAALEELVEAHGVELRKLPDDVLQRLRAISADVVAEIADSSPIAARIYQSLKAYQEDVSRYYEIAEHAYLDARSSTNPQPEKNRRDVRPEPVDQP